MLVLHHYHSSVCSQKVRICLAKKGLDWESRHVDLFIFQHWEPAFIKLNRKAVVPVLVHDGKVVTESNVIMEYLEDEFPAVRLRPENHHDRAKARLWAFNSEEIAHGNVNIASHNPRHAKRLAKYTKAELESVVSRCPNPLIAARFIRRVEHGVSQREEDEAYAALDYLLDDMEDALRDSQWLVGGAYSMADIAMAPFVLRIELLERPEMVGAARRPRLAAWWQRVQERPAVHTALAFDNPDTSDSVKR